MRHVAKHVPDAEVIHNPPPLSDSFRCLWHECGFETINSSEMVRAILLHIMLKVLPLLGATHKLPRLPHQGQVSRSEYADDQQHEALQDGLGPEKHSA